MRVQSLIILSVFFFLGAVACSTAPTPVDRAPGDVVSRAEEDESFDEKVARQKEIIRRQEIEMQRQERELQDLQRQKYHNEALRTYEKK